LFHVFKPILSQATTCKLVFPTIAFIFHIHHV